MLFAAVGMVALGRLVPSKRERGDRAGGAKSRDFPLSPSRVNGQPKPFGAHRDPTAWLGM